MESIGNILLKYSLSHLVIMLATNNESQGFVFIKWLQDYHLKTKL